MKTAGIFHAAIEKLERYGQLVGRPESFQGYLRQQAISKKNTASYISVDQFDRLDSELAQSKCMVFRLGRADKSSSHTQFALAKYENKEDFFIFDSQEFSTCRIEPFVPNIAVRSLYTYQLIPRLTESSLINLGFASGLIQEALGIHNHHDQVIPATGQSTFTFPVKPLSYCQNSWIHNKGQVEIDGLFVGRRSNKEQLFIIEAKASSKLASISKHKLAYPIYALAEKVPSHMPLIPIYIRCTRNKKSILFHIAELSMPDPRVRQAEIDQLKVKKVRILSLDGF